MVGDRFPRLLVVDSRYMAHFVNNTTQRNVNNTTQRNVNNTTQRHAAVVKTIQIWSQEALLTMGKAATGKAFCNKLEAGNNLSERCACAGG